VGTGFPKRTCANEGRTPNRGYRAILPAGNRESRRDKPAHATRIGGDEFAVILPGTHEPEAEAMIQALRDLVDVTSSPPT
jgi:predicted signal transduction protein with EAL and GGDEF domain